MRSLPYRPTPLVVLAILLWLAAPALAALELSELLADPVTDWNADGALSSRDDEWIEVTNTGPGTLNLADYFVRDALGTEPHLRLSGTLLAGQAAVFYGSHAVAWQQASGLTISGLSLNNSGDTVELWRGDPQVAGSVLADSYAFLAHEVLDDRATGRLIPGGNWGIFDYLNPYVGTLEPQGTGCAPTPGEVNRCGSSVPVEPTTWGSLKGLFR